MGIKYIHVVLILVSIGLCIGFGFWTLHRSFMVSAYVSFTVAVGLTVYCFQFIKKMKAL